MEVIQNTALRFKVPDHFYPNLVSGIERLETLRDYGMQKEVVVYWGYEEAALLAYLFDGEQPNSAIPDIPSPILKDYNWPGIFRPFDHQKDTASFLSLRKRAFCFNEAGTGKTSAAIWAADYLMNKGLIKRVLVICPLSIMHTAWRTDIFNTAMHRSSAVAYGSSTKRKTIINGDYEFIIINYDGVNIVRDEIAKGG